MSLKDLIDQSIADKKKNVEKKKNEMIIMHSLKNIKGFCSFLPWIMGFVFRSFRDI